jgi:hypothetical protein
MKKRACGMWGRGFLVARGYGRCAEPVGQSFCCLECRDRARFFNVAGADGAALGADVVGEPWGQRG